MHVASCVFNSAASVLFKGAARILTIDNCFATRAIHKHPWYSICSDVTPEHVSIFCAKVNSDSRLQLPHRNHLVLGDTRVQRYSPHCCLFDVQKKHFLCGNKGQLRFRKALMHQTPVYTRSKGRVQNVWKDNVNSVRTQRNRRSLAIRWNLLTHPISILSSMRELRHNRSTSRHHHSTLCSRATAAHVNRLKNGQRVNGICHA